MDTHRPLRAHRLLLWAYRANLVQPSLPALKRAVRDEWNSLRGAA